MNKLLGIVVTVSMLLFGQCIYADADCGEKFKQMVQSLKLDENQQAKIKTIKEQLRTTLKDNWERMKALREQINQQVQSDNMDTSKVDELINTKVQLIGTVMKAKVNAQHEIYGVLNAKQKTQYHELRKEWEDKMTKKFEECKDKGGNE